MMMMGLREALCGWAELRRCCRFDLEGCVSNRSLDRVIGFGCGHENRASW